MAATARVAVIDGGFRFELDGLADGTYRLCPTTTGITIDTDAVGKSTTCGTAVIAALSVGTTGGRRDRSGRTGTQSSAAPDGTRRRHLRSSSATGRRRSGSSATPWSCEPTEACATSSTTPPPGHRRRRRHLHTRDVAWNEPVLFAAPPAGTCDGSEFSKAALWPESAVAIPQDDGTDRVVVVMSKVCLGATWLDIETVGFAVAEYRYDPTDPRSTSRSGATSPNPIWPTLTPASGERCCSKRTASSTGTSAARTPTTGVPASLPESDPSRSPIRVHGGTGTATTGRPLRAGCPTRTPPQRWSCPAARTRTCRSQRSA